jgi:hypothetical protein
MRVSSDPESPHYVSQPISVRVDGETFCGSVTEWVEFDDVEGWVDTRVRYYGGYIERRIEGEIMWSVGMHKAASNHAQTSI